MYAPSEPHGEEEEGFFRVGIYQKDECRQTTITARRHSLFIITSPSSLTTLLLPWGSANQSVPPEWNSNEAERLRATCESRCRLLCMLQRMNTGIRKFTAMPIATRKSTSASRNNGFVPLSYVRITATDRIPIVPSA